MENPHVSAGLDSSHDASMDSATRDLDNALNASQEPDEPSLATAAAAARVFSESSELQVPASLSAKWPPATRELDCPPEPLALLRRMRCSPTVRPPPALLRTGRDATRTREPLLDRRRVRCVTRYLVRRRSHTSDDNE